MSNESHPGSNNKRILNPKPSFSSLENKLIAELRKPEDKKTFVAPEGHDLILEIPKLEREISEKLKEVENKFLQKIKDEFTDLENPDEIKNKKIEIFLELEKKVEELILENPENTEDIRNLLSLKIKEIRSFADKKIEEIEEHTQEEEVTCEKPSEVKKLKKTSENYENQNDENKTFKEGSFTNTETKRLNYSDEKIEKAQRETEDHVDNMLRPIKVEAQRRENKKRDEGFKGVAPQYGKGEVSEDVKGDFEKSNLEFLQKIKNEEIFENKGIEKIDLKSVKWPPEDSEALKSVRETVAAMSGKFSNRSEVEADNLKRREKELNKDDGKWGELSSEEILQKQELFKEAQNYPENKYLKSAIEMIENLDKNNPESAEKMQFILKEFMTSDVVKEKKEKFWNRTVIQRRIIDPENNPKSESYKKAIRRIENDGKKHGQGIGGKAWTFTKWTAGISGAVGVAGTIAAVASPFVFTWKTVKSFWNDTFAKAAKEGSNFKL